MQALCDPCAAERGEDVLRVEGTDLQTRPPCLVDASPPAASSCALDAPASAVLKFVFFCAGAYY